LIARYAAGRFRHIDVPFVDIGPEVPAGQKRELVSQGQLTTTVEQLAYAFLSPGNLPPENSYAKAITAKIKALGV
jgi:hypothetical protein